jgi:uncharacterized membrane protein YeaQ/YmgE (transglycosylase-associated protein family)
MMGDTLFAVLVSTRPWLPARFPNHCEDLAALLFPGEAFGISIHGVFGWLLMGLLAGWLSGEMVRGKGFGCLGNILLGLIGAVVGGWLFEQLHIETLGFIGGLAAATVGAVLIVALARGLSGGD